MRLKTCLLVSAASLLLTTDSGLAQQIIRVPQDVGSLGQAVSQVNNRGIIEMAQGTYAAPANGFRIRNLSKEFTVRAASGAQVVLDGQGKGPVLRLENTNGNRILFEGLTFANGFSTAEAVGGGVTVANAVAGFKGCTFRDNLADGNTTGGGGARVDDGSTAVFIDSEFLDNSSPNRGGGMAVLFSEVYVLRGNFERNRVNLVGHTPSSPGGGIYVLDSKLRVWDSTFEGNEAGWVGGAIYAFGTYNNPVEIPAADVQVVGSTFVDNAAEPDPCCVFGATKVGGALHAEDQVAMRVYDSVFEGNRAERGGALDTLRSRVEIHGSVFRGNEATGSTAVVAAGGAIFVTSVDLPDGSTNNGAINRPPADLTITNSYFQGRFGGATETAHQGGCVFAAGDVNRLYGQGGVAQDGTAADNRAPVLLRDVVFSDCDAVRPEGAPGGFGNGGGGYFRLVDLEAENVMVVDSDAVGMGTGGGGMAFFDQSVAKLTGATFAGNSAGRTGGALFASGSSVTVSQSRFFSNEVSPGVSELVRDSMGAAIFTTPAIDAGNPSREADATGLVSNTVFANNVGLPVWEIDQDNGPINAMRYNNNRFFETTFPDKVFINILLGRAGESVGSLNGTVVARSNGTSSDKSTVANTELGARPAEGAVVAVPATLHSAGEPSATPRAFLGYGWSGGSATLAGGALPGPSGVVEVTNTGSFPLRVNGATADTDSVVAGACTTGPLLCLNGDRFRTESAWRNFQGLTGIGIAEKLTNDTGYFFFFDPANVELTVKALDGRAITNHFWVFYGALSNVEYRLTVVDTENARVKAYENPRGNFASVGDTFAFPNFVGSPTLAALPESVQAGPLGPFEPLAAPMGVDCTPSATNLCLNGGRFKVEVEWKDFQGQEGVGMAEPLTGDTGYFWFFQDTNVEVILKVLDGRPLTGFFWVFYGALSNVEYTITVTDTATGDVKTYFNPATNFASVGDTMALPGE